MTAYPLTAPVDLGDDTRVAAVFEEDWFSPPRWPTASGSPGRRR
ncbi:MAG: hypothetical protein WKF86_10440 [Acidimicrobiales bacterium]